MSISGVEQPYSYESSASECPSDAGTTSVKSHSTTDQSIAEGHSEGWVRVSYIRTLYEDDPTVNECSSENSLIDSKKKCADNVSDSESLSKCNRSASTGSAAGDLSNREIKSADELGGNELQSKMI